MGKKYPTKIWPKIFNAIQDGILVIDLELNVLHHNETMENRVGQPFVGKKCYQAVLGRDEPCTPCPAIKAIESKTVQRHEASRLLPSGEMFWRQMSVYPIINEAGKVIGVVEYIENITERRKAQDALKESEDKYRSLFENAPVGICIADINGHIISLNNAMMSLSGYSKKEEYIKMTLADLCRFQESYSDMTESLKKNGFAENVEITLKHTDGSVFDALVSVRPIKIEGQACWQLMVQDISPLKKAETELRRAHAGLEMRVHEKTRELETKRKNLFETNMALKVLLEKREKDKIELQDNILSNLKQLIEPYLDRLKESGLNQSQAPLLEILESSIKEIVSPFTRKLALEHQNLTPQEIQIVNLIKKGKSTKEIANLLNLSHRTVDSHRGNIRKKLGLQNKKANLRSHLLSTE